MSRLMRGLLVLVMVVLSYLPLSALRALGDAIGFVLYKAVKKRAHVARVNLRLCFPEWGPKEVESHVLLAFQYFAKAGHYTAEAKKFYAEKQNICKSDIFFGFDFFFDSIIEAMT